MAGILLVGCIMAFFHINHCESTTVNFTDPFSKCGNEYAGNSTFQPNLNTLLSTMKNSSASTKFYNGSVGGESGGDRVYGLYFCTGDLSQSDCRRCILQATGDVPQKCPNAKAGIIGYDYCELHYSNQSFFGIINLKSYVKITNPNQYVVGTTEPMKLMSKLVEEAPFQQPLMFSSAIDERNNRYGMAQCSNDLSVLKCQNCLSSILGEIASCCTQYVGWRYLTPTCWIRYEKYPFLMNINASTEITVTHLCSNGEFPRGKESKLNANLNRLLSSLLTNGSKAGFYKTSIGSNSTSDVVHGLVLCRGDVNSTTCKNCLAMSTKNISQYCPNKTDGIVWYENCLLRYSDKGFFGVVDYDGRTDCNQEVATEDAEVAIAGLMTRLIEVATNQQSLMYAAGNVPIKSNLSIYGQLQCTRDLSRDSCKNCLNFGLTNVFSNCKLRNGWLYLSRSCILRYEDFLFFDPTVASVSSQSDNEGKHSDHIGVIIGIIVSINGTFLVGFIFYIWKKRRNSGQRTHLMVSATSPSNESFRWMDINTIRRATNNFSHTNKLGEGGFGPVYKGTLPDGNEIAIKRLSNASTQGSEEFKNEVQLIWKLQHRNLVKLLGCCTHGDEKLLVYEYLPNGSLDNFIFDPEKRSLWDWRTLTNIIFGIARGLIYLHEDSQLKVIHRDMKPSNILLDLTMNAKISDFGMARIYNGETEVKTHRVVGTYGYLAPEFAMAGVFSAKSDVFSFGVILLEIICGRKNSSSYFIEIGHSLLSQAWSLWSEGRGRDFVDSMIMDHNLFPLDEVMRFYNIGLLCVQENTTDGPLMSTVLLMLKSEQMVFPQPKRPPSVFMHDDGSTMQSQVRSSNRENSTSSNKLTISVVDGR